MENFNYHRPATVKAAAAMMKKSKDGKFLGGGHTLINWRRYLNDFAPRLFQD